MKTEREYVEIGGVKWATMNVGAEKETDFGLYFQHGEIQGYPHPTNLCKFIKEPKNLCDSVKTYWGDKWRMPTREDFYVLRNSTTAKWVENYKDSGVNGILFVDKTDSSKKLFFPACGYCVGGDVSCVGDYGYYWSSSFGRCNVSNAWYLSFNDGYMGVYSYRRFYGYGVRGVLVDK